MSESAAWEQTIEAFNTFLEAAEASNVLVTSEAVYGMLAHDFYTHKWLVEQTDRPAHRVNFDPSHHVLYGIEDMRWLITQWGARIAHVHIKDGIGIPQGGEVCVSSVGRREGQLEAVLRGARRD